MAELFIVRDPDNDGDVATVWNWKRREWCWDLDGEYLEADGFVYRKKASAEARVADLNTYTAGRGYTSLRQWTNVRIVDREGLWETRA